MRVSCEAAPSQPSEGARCFTTRETCQAAPEGTRWRSVSRSSAAPAESPAATGERATISASPSPAAASSARSSTRGMAGGGFDVAEGGCMAAFLRVCGDFTDRPVWRGESLLCYVTTPAASSHEWPRVPRERPSEERVMLQTLWRKFDRDWGWNLARLLAYTCIQTLFAVLGLQLIVLSLVLRLLAPDAEQGLIAHILRLLPDHVTISAVSSLEESLRHAPVWILLIGLPITLWYGTRFFVVLESVLCVIFRRRQRTWVRQNRMALLMLLLFAVLLPVIVLSTTVVPHIGVPAARYAAASG